MADTRKILITGHKGMLGHQLVARAPQGTEIRGVDLPEADITDLKALSALVADFAPDQIIHGAAMTDVDGCELKPELAFKVNGVGARNVAQAAHECGAEILYVSTDYVFPGDAKVPYVEYDPVAPPSMYGRSKLWGEQAVRDHCPRFYIARTQWLYGPGGKNFVDTIRRAASERDRLTVVDDQHGAPTFTYDLADAIHNILAERPGYGIYHCSNKGETTWWGFAKRIVEKSGLSTPVDPMGSDQLDRPAPRPQYSVMRNLSLELTIGDSFRPWEEALDAYLEIAPPL